MSIPDDIVIADQREALAVLAVERDSLRSRLAAAEANAKRYSWIRRQFKLRKRDKDAYHVWVPIDPAAFRGPSIDAICDRENAAADAISAAGAGEAT
jgi:hypothetical protein